MHLHKGKRCTPLITSKVRLRFRAKWAFRLMHLLRNKMEKYVILCILHGYTYMTKQYMLFIAHLNQWCTPMYSYSFEPTLSIASLCIEDCTLKKVDLLIVLQHHRNKDETRNTRRGNGFAFCLWSKLKQSLPLQWLPVSIFSSQHDYLPKSLRLQLLLSRPTICHSKAIYVVNM